MNDDIELLREAARLMRERAKAASAGPWIAHPDGLVWTQRNIPGDPVSGSTEVEDAQHIASWHPVVALAVADWLLEASVGGGLSETRCALAVAGAYMGVES